MILDIDEVPDTPHLILLAYFGRSRGPALLPDNLPDPPWNAISYFTIASCLIFLFLFLAPTGPSL